MKSLLHYGLQTKIKAVKDYYEGDINAHDEGHKEDLTDEQELLLLKRLRKGTMKKSLLTRTSAQVGKQMTYLSTAERLCHLLSSSHINKSISKL